VDASNPSNNPAIAHITDAPPIITAPNPTTKRALKVTPCTHWRHTWSNIPGSVPPISNVNNGPVIIAAPEATPAPRRSPQMIMAMQTLPQPTKCTPRLHFVPIPGGLQSHNIISQEAIDFLTKCVWANMLDIFTPTKLQPQSTPSCLHYKQVALPIVHPTTGETISSYKMLMHDPVMSEIWQTAFGKDSGSMAQGN
jgi:hypothetical protein